MWSYLKSLALRTMLTLACLALLTVNGLQPSVTDGSLMDLANRTPAAASIAMQVVSLPTPESRLPRGSLATASVAAEAKPEPAFSNPATDPAEIVLDLYELGLGEQAETFVATLRRKGAAQ